MVKKLICSFIFIALAFGLQACGRDIKPETPCNFVQNNKAQRVSWSGALPIVLYYDSSVPPEYYRAIEDAIASWHAESGRLLFKIGGTINSTTGPARDGANVIYWMKGWEPDRPFEQARTTVFWVDDRLIEADIRINAKNFLYAVGKQPGRVDVTSLLVHELGHVLGLAHTDTSNSVMVKSLPNNYERRKPSLDDIDSLRCEY